MFRSRKRKAKESEQRGIKVAKLGAPFEWTDERLRVALEAFPSFKRLLGSAKMDLVLALNMYYDDITKRWEVLSAVDISTVRNQARFYLAEPSELTEDVYENMRIDERHRLYIYNEGAEYAVKGKEEQAEIVDIGFVQYFFDNKDYIKNQISFQWHSNDLTPDIDITVNIKINGAYRLDYSVTNYTAQSGADVIWIPPCLEFALKVDNKVAGTLNYNLLVLNNVTKWDA